MKTIVIVGGGVAGHRIAYALQSRADVVLIDPKEYIEVPMAGPRMLVEPGRSRDALIPYAEFLPHVRHVRGTVSFVRRDNIEVNGATAVPFDYLVLATGSNYSHDIVKAASGDRAARAEHYVAWAERIRDAKHIAIIGGGPVGVELAAEILEEQPGKQLSLFDSSPVLLAETGRGPQRDAEKFLRCRGAHLHLGQRVDAQSIDADLLIPCYGYRIDTAYLRDLPGALDPQGRVIVTPSLSSPSYPNIFAAGDITALPEPKLGLWAGKHAKVISANLRALLANPASTHLQTYKPATGSQVMLVTLGRNHGTAHLPVIGGFSNSWFARKMKSQDVLIGRYRQEIGLPPSAIGI